METPNRHYTVGISPFSLKNWANTIVVLHRLMLEMDKHENLDHHVIRQSDAYVNAEKELGWNIDWDAMAEKGLSR